MKKTYNENSGGRVFLTALIAFLIVLIVCAGIIYYVMFMAPAPKKDVAPAGTSAESQQMPAETEAPPKAPVFENITASSTNDESEEYSYPASNTTDNDKTTAWSPDPDDVLPWIELSSDSMQTVKGIEIENGYSKSNRLYESNHRAKSITVECNGKQYSYTLKDSGCGKKQKISFTETLETDRIKITVNSVYKGDKYNDLCITQITPY